MQGMAQSKGNRRLAKDPSCPTENEESKKRITVFCYTLRVMVTLLFRGVIPLLKQSKHETVLIWTMRVATILMVSYYIVDHKGYIYICIYSIYLLFH
uniref:Ovule protein n=1 Tax=Heterorhabditis bacteriophora TaxID=37862 RepID=A0A1I7X6B3_HETBA